MRAVIQTATGKAEEEPIVEPSATTTTPPVVVLDADPRRQKSTGHALALHHRGMGSYTRLA